MRKLQGFTIIELIMVVVLLSVISILSAPFLRESFNAFTVAKKINTKDWQGRLALTRMSRDLLTVRSQQTVVINPNSLTFVNQAGNSVSYSLSADRILRNGIALADNISALEFNYLNSNGAATVTPANVRYIEVHLSADVDGIQGEIQSLINLRNTV